MSNLQTQYPHITKWAVENCKQTLDIDAVILDCLDSLENTLPGESRMYELGKQYTISGNTEFYYGDDLK